MCLTGPEAQVSHLVAVLDPLMIIPTQQQQVNIWARIRQKLPYGCVHQNLANVAPARYYLLRAFPEK